MKIEEDLLVRLGFIKSEDVNDTPYHYYTHENINLITNCSDEIGEEGWTVGFFDSDDYLITEAEDLTNFVQMMGRFKRSI